jgi:hypothetical protein
MLPDMELTLVNSELTESTLYRSHGMGRRLSSADVSKLLYLNTLALVLMIKDTQTNKFAREYAKKISRHGGYTLFRTGANDLYTLAYHVAHPDNTRLSLSDKSRGVENLERLSFDYRRHWQIMSYLAQGKLANSSEYLLRLATQLKMLSGRYNNWRRLVTDYASLSDREKHDLATDISSELNRIARPQDLIKPLQKVKRPSGLLKKAAGTAAGAYVGSKVAQKLDINKTAGTGIGAIAGYWAAKKL